MMRVAFRCDASPVIGGGHLMRCLTLADELKRRGADCLFLGSGETALHAGRIGGRGHRFVAIEQSGQANDWQADANATRAAMSMRPDWLVVDHYGLDYRWQALMRPAVDKIAVIDDLADRRHDCDLLIDHNISNLGLNRYDGLVPAHCGRALGPRHALINPAYAAARNASRDRSGPVERILLFITAGDDGGLTEALLLRLSADGLGALAIDVVSTSTNPRLAALRAACAKFPGATLHIDAGDLVQISACADIAIGAAGGAALERCCLGIPSVTLVIAANQQPGAVAMLRLGATRLSGNGPEGIMRVLAELKASPERRSLSSMRSMMLVDGQGADRVARMMAGELKPIYLREACLDDAALLLSWRNDPVVRAASLQQDPISLTEHESWLRRVLANPSRQLLIAMAGEQSIGTIRFDHGTDGMASISLSVAPAWQAGGLGSALLAEGELWAIERVPATCAFDAVVRFDNMRSQALFERAGYATMEKRDDLVLYRKPCAGEGGAFLNNAT